MWDPKIESKSSQNSGAAVDKKLLLAAEDDPGTDSGFMSSGQLSASDIQEHISETTAEKLSPIVEAEQKKNNNNSSSEPSTTDDQSHQAKSKEVEQDTEEDSGLIADDDAALLSLIADQKKMLLERGIDDGLAEWFCNLKLRSDAGNQINNLGKKSPSSSPTSSLSGRLNICSSAEQPSKRSKQTNKNGIKMPDEEQLWEVCYKQDANGDT